MEVDQQSQAQGPPLSGEQQDACTIIQSTNKPVIILTGQAGSGKSTIIKHLMRRPDLYTVCATTGKAAMNVDGRTVDSVFSIKREDWSIRSHRILEQIMMEIPDCIIIDEASMIGLNMANLIADVAATYRKKLVLVGDWAQARPVKDDWIMGSRLLADYEFIKLVQNHRQDGDRPFMDVLNRIRMGEVDDTCTAMLSSRIQPVPTSDADLRLYATNARVDAYNRYRLFGLVNSVATGFTVLKAEFRDMRKTAAQQRYPRDDQFKNTAIEQSRLAYDEPMAIGCRVLITVNSPDGSFVNGDTGELIDIIDTMPGFREKLKQSPQQMVGGRPRRLRILLDRTQGEIEIAEMKRDVKNATGEEVQHSVYGFPVVLGYACTIHKAQGMTVNRAWVDMMSIMNFPDQTSRHGLAYVALSRTRTLDGLHISAWEPRAVYCDPAIKHLV